MFKPFREVLIMVSDEPPVEKEEKWKILLATA